MRVRPGLAGRLAVILAALVAGTALVASTVSLVATDARVRADIDRFLTQRADEIAGGTRQRPRAPGDGRDRGPAIDLRGLVGDLADADTSVQILSRDGSVELSIGTGLPVDATDLRLAGGPGSVLRTVPVDGRDHRLVTRHLDGGGAVQVAQDLAPTNELLASIRRRSILLGLVLSAVAAAIGWLVARRATRPLRALADSVERVAGTGDPATPTGLVAADLDRTDEIGRLARRFDGMLSALARSRDQQRQLVQDAAHELRTPLTSINANVDLLARAPDLDEETRRSMLESIRSELGELNGLFTEIVELATDARDTPPHRPCDLRAVTDAAVAAFRTRSDRPVTVDGDPSPVLGDPAALGRAIGNLLSNAEKYSPAGSAITVRVGRGTVTVVDRGAGIAAEDADRVFDRFYRSDTARSQPGSGLGLAIVAKVVGDHGGTPFIRPGSGADGGTEAGFTLPARADDRRVAEPLE